MWDPTTYLRFSHERARPFFDLVARIDIQSPHRVVDLGCGPGTLTATLTRRWPSAQICGIDSSAEMIKQAAALNAPVEFCQGDVRAWQPSPQVDVVISNAVLQWVPGHADLLTAWARQLTPGSWLAVQVPGNYTAPSHRALRAVATEGPWAAVLAPVLRDNPVLEPVEYADLLMSVGCEVDTWETTYLHVLPANSAQGGHPLLDWMEGTVLRPVRAALPDDDWMTFRSRLDGRLREAYPVRHGRVYFPFRRIFLVARTAARPEERNPAAANERQAP